MVASGAFLETGRQGRIHGDATHAVSIGVVMSVAVTSPVVMPAGVVMAAPVEESTSVVGRPVDDRLGEPVADREAEVEEAEADVEAEAEVGPEPPAMPG